ncbi:MAG: single-stranded DNA-binding protein [Desulfarculus sp.]|nr:single-stranded DNA-binding protein [Pseudomonadota bacterium]MBV1717137.1 single-stranded DNA-binding protein [Desulfarculus sp.]MBU4573551.1 single-stranded DNA-binding protein [Pseudomonadota bacterium]MBU4598363.1 single-stranded DNA-binding protein [Pseudomonadota bacterium]MBV1740349.1 single-stranded DNA-binding protein [Desulfarculus sp.]
MARGVNKVILIGNLGADPELKYTPSGTAVCTFRLATSESFKDRDGNMQERTEWHRIVAWTKLGEIAAQYLSKGRQVFVEGSIRTRSWEDQSGERKYMTEIVARDIQFLGGGPGQGGQGGGGGYGGGQGGGGNDFGGPPSTDDDIPF